MNGNREGGSLLCDFVSCGQYKVCLNSRWWFGWACKAYRLRTIHEFTLFLLVSKPVSKRRAELDV